MINNIPFLLFCWCLTYNIIPYTNFYSIIDNHTGIIIFILHINLLNVLTNLVNIVINLIKYYELVYYSIEHNSYEHLCNICITMFIGIHNACQMHLICYKLPICIHKDKCINIDHVNITHFLIVLFYVCFYIINCDINWLNKINNFIEKKLKQIFNIRNLTD